MERYAFDIGLFVWRILPIQFRKPFHFGWLMACLKPIQTLHERFLSYAQEARIDANANSQTAVFEWLLNRRFNNSGTEIYIENVYLNRTLAQEYRFYITENQFPSSYWFFLSEQNAQSYSVYLSELFSRGQTFIVHVPIALQGVIDENELQAVVNELKLTDKTYAINYY
ncbi:MAG: hypothetical protein AAF740_09830 [Bacteroidota bacterium]